MSLRIGLVTDIHHGPDIDVRVGSSALRLLRQFVARMRDEFHPDLVVDLGDRINDIDGAVDRRRLAEVREILEQAGAPVLYAFGNHDLINVSHDDARAILGKRADHESLDVHGHHVVVLNTQDPTIEGVGGTLSDAQLDWLERDLAATSLPVLVFSHHPLDEQDPTRHWYFKDHPEHALARNRTRARRILTASGRVRAVINGHMHLNSVEVIDGIPYVTVMSLVDKAATGVPSECFAEIHAENGRALEISVRGRQSMAASFRRD